MIKPKGVNYMINWYRLPHILDFDLLENLVDKPDLSLERMHTDMNLGYQICFGKGKFDEWCAFTKYRGNSGMMLYAMPRDVYYFSILKVLSEEYNALRVYGNCKHVFEHAGREIDDGVIEACRQMSMGYGDTDGKWMFNALMHVYYGMIAENNKIIYDANGQNPHDTRLGASIKMNGIHSLCLGGRTVKQAADECRGVHWLKIARQCMARDIIWQDRRNPMLYKAVMDEAKKDTNLEGCLKPGSGDISIA